MGGKVYLVGAGPWDPGLLTLRGKELLGRADLILYDYLVNPILLEHASARAEKRPTGRPPHRMTQDDICAALVEAGRKGLQVVRLKGGDPFVFGRGGEEASALAEANIPYEVVPGVTAAIASAAYAGIPVTHRAYGSTLGFVTGHFMDDGPDDQVDWEALSHMSTLAVYMGARRLDALRVRLLSVGVSPNKPVALVHWATRADQRTIVTTVGDMPKAAEEHAMTPPMTALIGDVVSLRQEIMWYEQRPLYGQRILVTRSQSQARVFSHRLKELGADVLPYPSIEFQPLPVDLDAISQRLEHFDWVLLTSANAVDFFLHALTTQNLDIRALGAARLACVGPVTARRLAHYGLIADLVPEEYVAEGFLDSIQDRLKTGQRCLLPRAERARDVIPDTLAGWGVECTVLPVYQTVVGTVEKSIDQQVRAGMVDIITFTSSSTVRHFIERFSEDELNTLRKNTVAACIGPVTAKTARENRLDVQIVPEEYTVEAMTDAIVRWCQEQSMHTELDTQGRSED